MGMALRMPIGKRIDGLDRLFVGIKKSDFSLACFYTFVGLHPMSLPIEEIEVEFLQAFRDKERLILEAPTGSGKSTQIPQMIDRAGFLEAGELVVLQPRRIAARMLARRVAFEMGERLGDRVGYQVRNENVSSRQTRI